MFCEKADDQVVFLSPAAALLRSFKPVAGMDRNTATSNVQCAAGGCGGFGVNDQNYLNWFTVKIVQVYSALTGLRALLPTQKCESSC